MKRILFILALVLPSSANAQLIMRPYIGASYIYSDSKLKYNYADDFETQGDSYSANIGMKISKYMGVEGFYQKSSAVENKRADFVNEAKFTAYGADIVGYLPMDGKYFNFLVALGFGSYKFESTNPDFSRYDFGGRAGVGLQFNITRNIGIRAMARHVFISTEHVSSLNEVSAGVQLQF